MHILDPGLQWIVDLFVMIDAGVGTFQSQFSKIIHDGGVGTGVGALTDDSMGNGNWWLVQVRNGGVRGGGVEWSPLRANLMYGSAIRSALYWIQPLYQQATAAGAAAQEPSEWRERVPAAQREGKMKQEKGTKAMKEGNCQDESWS